MNFVLLGWFRPVRAWNADNIVRLRPSCPTEDQTAAFRIARCGVRAMARLRDGPRHVSERFLTKIKLSAV